jgi:hypothetical protein
LNRNFVFTNGLQNYWPFENSFEDIIGGMNLFGGRNVSFTFDINSKPLSSVSFRNGYLRAPNGTYFNGSDFSIMAWVKVRKFNYYERIIDFGNGPALNNVDCVISQLKKVNPYFEIINDVNGPSSATVSSVTLKIEKWTHIACVLLNQIGHLYVDGVLKSSASFVSSVNVIRKSNFVGYSNWIANSDADADMDELKIFNRGLTKEEVNFEMKNFYYD